MSVNSNDQFTEFGVFFQTSKKNISFLWILIFCKVINSWEKSCTNFCKIGHISFQWLVFLMGVMDEACQGNPSLHQSLCPSISCTALSGRFYIFHVFGLSTIPPPHEGKQPCYYNRGKFINTTGWGLRPLKQKTGKIGWEKARFNDPCNIYNRFNFILSCVLCWRKMSNKQNMQIGYTSFTRLRNWCPQYKI